jgi:hypothetical protein
MQTDGQKNRHDDANSRISQFCERRLIKPQTIQYLLFFTEITVDNMLLLLQLLLIQEIKVFEDTFNTNRYIKH